MRVEKNSVFVNDPEVAGFPATYWHGDRWVCPVCQARIVIRAIKPFPMEVLDNPTPESMEFRYDAKTTAISVGQ